MKPILPASDGGDPDRKLASHTGRLWVSLKRPCLNNQDGEWARMITNMSEHAHVPTHTCASTCKHAYTHAYHTHENEFYRRMLMSLDERVKRAFLPRQVFS